jgi:hypothetical protein
MALEIFGNLFGGNTTTGLDALLNADQRRLMNQQANLSAAAALLAASGPSRQRVGLGQALGAAMQAGQQGYQQARAGSLQELLLGERLKEAQRNATAEETFRNLLNPPAQPAPAGGPVATPPAAIDGQGVQVFAPDAPVRPVAAPQAGIFSNLTPEQRALVGSLGREKGTQYLLDTMKPEATPEAIRTLRALGLPVTLEGLRQLDKPEASPSEVRILQATNTPVTFENIMRLRQSGASNVKVNVPVDMTGGQKGFENEMKLGSAFKGEPIYKDFSDMKSSFSQVVSSLSAGTPIGDVAGATKIMKLLDPGSVVRESELAIAMQAAGRMDRLQNYFNNMITGEKLTPTQREDFKALANELYAAAGDAYNKKRAEYEDFGKAYGFKNLNTALGPSANIPSLVRKTPGGAAGGGAGGGARTSTGPRLERGPDGMLRYVP